MKNKEELILKVSSVFWLVAKIWSYKTWVAERLYPIDSPFVFLENIPNPVHFTLYTVSLLGIGCLILIESNRLIIGVLFVVELLSCLLDTLRWQPWEYMYMCVLLVYLINFNNKKNIIWLVHLLLVSMYIFSGLHKLNNNFLDLVWVKMILTSFVGISQEAVLKHKMYFVGLIIPIVEIASGLLLAFSKRKKHVGYFLVLVHLIILLIIGPLGLNYNSVIWFWNIAIIFILIITYFEPLENPKRAFYFSNFYWIILWVILPIFSFSNSWYQYFSFSLYSGKSYQVYLCFQEKPKEIEPYIRKGKNEFCSEELYINLQDLALKETKVMPIPDVKIQKRIAENIIEKYPDTKIFFHNYTTKEKIELN